MNNKQDELCYADYERSDIYNQTIANKDERRQLSDIIN